MRKHTAEEISAEENTELRYCIAVLSEVVLSGNERLQVHLDFMNAVGDIVTIEDVDDMGGSVRNYDLIDN